MSVSGPPPVGVYCHVCCIHLVNVCVLLNIILYLGNKYCMYFVSSYFDLLYCNNRWAMCDELVKVWLDCV